MIKTVIFDMDGTLLDTLDDLTNAVNFSLACVDYPKRSRDEIRSYLGDGLEELICRAFPENYDEEKVLPALAAFKDYYAEHGNENTAPYDGVLPLLEKLQEKGIRTAVLSNKYEDAVIELAAEYFPGKFDSLRGERVDVERKPAPDAVFSIMEELSTVASETMYVGDSEVDMQTGINAGVMTVGVLWGFRDKAVLEENGAHHIIAEPMQLMDLL